jgi:hypothetical protein
MWYDMEHRVYKALEVYWVMKWTLSVFFDKLV